MTHHDASDSTIDSAEEVDATSRRRFFTRGAAAAAAMAAAGVVLSKPAGAANGDTMIVGAANSGTATTSLTGSQFNVMNGNGGRALVGRQYTSNGIGVLGDVGNSAVAGTGVKGYAHQGVGVHGEAGTSTIGGIGLRGTSGLGVPLLLDEGSRTMPPTSGAWTAGSFVVDGGALWYCHTGGSGTASRWARLSSVLMPLASPVRAYDSRVGMLPATGPKTPITAGTNRDIDLTGAGLLPNGSKAAYINITVVNTSAAGGFLKVFQAGAPVPTASNINWTSAGTTLANSTLVGLNSSGAITVRCGGTGASTDFIIDILAASA